MKITHRKPSTRHHNTFVSYSDDRFKKAIERLVTVPEYSLITNVYIANDGLYIEVRDKLEVALENRK